MNSIDDARNEMESVYTNSDDKRPWVVSYSGGKDSTLLLLLVCELIQKYGRNRDVYCIFSDTGIEQDGIVERVEKNFQGLEQLDRGIKTEIIKPDVKWKFFNTIVGHGYCAPTMQMRWCTSLCKTDCCDRWKTKTFKQEPCFIQLTGERSEESVTRQKKINLFYPSDSDSIFFTDTKTKRNEVRWLPIRNVKTKELWEYLAQFETFPWNEKLEELYKQYGADNYRDIIRDNKERRSGCVFCTAARNKNAGITKREKRFCRWLVNYSSNIKNRYLCYPKFIRVEKYDKYVLDVHNKRLGFGKFSIDSRKKILKHVQSLERAQNKIYITPEDYEFIYDMWKIDEERVKNGELIDARIYLKKPKDLFSDLQE